MTHSTAMWIKGLLAAGISGSATTITNMIVAPETFNLGDGLSKLGTAALISALLGVALYLKQSPIPPEEK